MGRSKVEACEWYIEYQDYPTTGFSGCVLSKGHEGRHLCEASLKVCMEALVACSEELAWADGVINGEHDTCGMCEAIVAAHRALSHAREVLPTGRVMPK